MNFTNQFLPLIGATISMGGIIFKMGQQSQQLEIVSFKVHAQEEKSNYTNKTMCEIHSDVTLLKNDIKYIKSHVNDIKAYINK